MNTPVPVLGFVAWSGTGKTTLLEQLIPLLRQHGLRIGLVKHTHHHFDIDQPGKDSYRLRQAGASQVLVGAKGRWALMVEQPEIADEAPLDELLGHLLHDQLDLVLVEGFKHETFPRIELHRTTLGKPLMYPQDEGIIAIATDDTSAAHGALPVLDINQPEQVAAFVLAWLRQR